jgi:hypothetical protein
MSEISVTKTVVTEEKAPVGSVPDKPGVTVVTPENFKEYVDEKLGAVPAEETEETNEDPEAVAAAELAKLEAEKKGPKEGDVDGSKVFFKGKWVGKHDFNYRLHVQTEAKTKEAEAKVKEAEARAKAAQEAREATEKREAALKAKYEPPRVLGSEPQPSQFTDITEYSKALKDWNREATIREYEEKQSKERQDQERVRVAKEWGERLTAIKVELPDYDEKVNASAVRISDQARDAIIESEIGPKILYHFAEHPEVAEALGKLTVGRMLKELGKLEATLGGQAKPAPKSETAAVEVSQAPAPITPLRGANAPVGTLRGTDEVPKGMSYDSWKKLWEAGKIK